MLIASQGQYVVRANPFPWIQHPAYEECAAHPVSLYEQIKPISQRLDDLAINKLTVDDPETYLRDRIRKFCGIDADYADLSEDVEDLDDIEDTSVHSPKEENDVDDFEQKQKDKWNQRKPNNSIGRKKRR